MLKLNLISKKLKKKLKIKIIFDFIKNNLYLAFVCIAFYAIVLLVFKILLQAHFIHTINETNIITKKTENNSLIIKKINSTIKNAKEVQVSYVAWSKLLDSLEVKNSNDIVITQINANHDTGSLALNGFAKNRDSLLQLKEQLENNENFSNIDFPIKNLLKQNDITFSINMKIISYEF